MDYSTTPTGTTVPAVTKSKFASKTNITAILLALFGLLVATGQLPAAFATPETVGGVVTAGGVLVAFFRTLTKNILV